MARPSIHQGLLSGFKGRERYQYEDTSSMFDFNDFKRSVKSWMKDNPKGTTQDLRDFCEEKIPTHQYTANEWVVDQTISWYRHILAQRDYVQKTGAGIYSEDDID